MKQDLLRFVTLGSVDDGKSTLIGQLLLETNSLYADHLAAVRADSRRLNRKGRDLALLLDGLRAEREQGITIDVAYRHFSTRKRRFIIADAPGHVQYTRNMATGASTADAAIILIDATKGIRPQSRLHSFIASLLGIRHVAVAVNKMDAIAYKERTFNLIRSEFSEFSARFSRMNLTFIPTSALKGENVASRGRRMPWYKGASILSFLEDIHIAGERNLIDFRFPVQYVNRPSRHFRGYCGSVASGVVRVGDEVAALPSGMKSRVKRIVTMDGNLPYAMPPLAVTLCLEDEIDISRGDMLTHPANLPFVDSEGEAMLIWLDDKPLKLNGIYGLKMGHRFLRASCSRLHFSINPDDLHRQSANTLKKNEVGRADLSFMSPAIFDEYQRNRATGGFILIDLDSNATAAAGTMIERTRRRVRRTLAKPTRASSETFPEHSLVKESERARLLGQRPATLWLTGLSGSGKSTVARVIERALTDLNKAVIVLDGDNIREGLNSDLGFSADDRSENTRRVAEVAKLMNEAGLIVITAFISPYRADRAIARSIIGPSRFLEIHLSTPLAVCEMRDPKGLYAKARKGELSEFTGVNAPYEEPEAPDLSLSAEKDDPNQMANKVMGLLEPFLRL